MKEEKRSDEDWQRLFGSEWEEAKRRDEESAAMPLVAVETPLEVASQEVVGAEVLSHLAMRPAGWKRISNDMRARVDRYGEAVTLGKGELQRSAYEDLCEAIANLEDTKA